jgi:monovalent cation/hydrogen antiporter
MRHAEEHDAAPTHQVLQLEDDGSVEREVRLARVETLRVALPSAKRQRLLALRADGTIGDAAFQRVEQELDLEELDLQQLAPGADSGGAS